ncbi:uncharacterized protein IUM83_18234 [Phytophthora cinnamomi]|uniref:uncharacterized protein n=1 Tax=Phytophthora cinnamomi TaxID=4785 RepID=UPI00355A7F2E|nr:hypothetical protein IUM83_18234 [Phytophthora cinnamomi]
MDRRPAAPANRPDDSRRPPTSPTPRTDAAAPRPGTPDSTDSTETMELNLRLPLEFSWMDEERPPFVPGPIPPVSRMYMRYVPRARRGARRVLEAMRDPTTMEGSVADDEREAKAESDA